LTELEHRAGDNSYDPRRQRIVRSDISRANARFVIAACAHATRAIRRLIRRVRGAARAA